MLEILNLNKKTRETSPVELEQINDLVQNPDNMIWLDFEILPNNWPYEQEMKILQETFKIHFLTIEDCVSLDHNPKIEGFDNYSFLIVSKIELENKKNLKIGKVSLIVGNNFLVTFRNEPINDIKIIKDSLKTNHSHFKDIIDIFYNIADEIIDDYIPIIDQFDLQIDHIENVLFRKPDNPGIIKALNKIRGNLGLIRRSVVSEKEIFFNLSKGYHNILSSKQNVFYRDIYDHLDKLLEKIDNQRDAISGILTVQLNLSTQKLNELIKFLTIISAILLPANLTAGIFGMNFQKMPLLNYEYGFNLTILTMITISVFMVIFFVQRKWF